MKFSVEKIKADVHHGPISFEQPVDVSELLELPNSDIRQVDTVQVYGMCVVENNEIIFDYTIAGEMTLPCARTLVDVTYPFRFRATEIFTTKQTEANEEEEVHFIGEDVIDLQPYILETIVLQMPYRVFAENAEIEDGEGWSFYTEDSFAKKEKERIDPRLAKLQQLLNDDKE